MTPLELRRLARRQALRALVISDGCRDYLVEIHSGNERHLLTDRRGRHKRFASLDQAKRAVRCAHHIALAVRVAADEACAGGTSTVQQISLVPLSTPQPAA